MARGHLYLQVLLQFWAIRPYSVKFLSRHFKGGSLICQDIYTCRSFASKFNRCHLADLVRSNAFRTKLTLENDIHLTRQKKINIIVLITFMNQAVALAKKYNLTVIH